MKICTYLCVFLYSYEIKLYKIKQEKNKNNVDDHLIELLQISQNRFDVFIH
jgi:hypothetical protein